MFKQMNFQMFPDNAVKREMANVSVVCANKPCDWKGPFKHYIVSICM